MWTPEKKMKNKVIGTQNRLKVVTGWGRDA